MRQMNLCNLSGRAAASLVATLCCSVAALAEVPRVATDIAPVHSLVAQVMGDLGAPDLVVPPGSSPHDHALRPSEARALQDADVVVWTGAQLTPGLADPIETLAEGARHLALLEVSGTVLLDMRDEPGFEPHSHDHDEDHADGDDHDHAHGEDHAHDNDHDHAHGEDHAHDDDHDHDHDEDHAHDDDHGHDHGDGPDPHAWLEPANAALWLGEIANVLGEIDPENAATYQANAAAGRAQIEELQAEVSAKLEGVTPRSFIVFHDAYQYFETAFNVPAAGAISVSDATKPSAARVAELREIVAELGAPCIAAEPQFNPGIVATVAEGTDARTIVMDPIGVALTPGPDLYGQMMRELGESLSGCTREGS